MGHFNPGGQWVEDQFGGQPQYIPQPEPPSPPPQPPPDKRQQGQQSYQQPTQQQDALGQTLVDQQNAMNRSGSADAQAQSSNWDQFMATMNGSNAGQPPEQDPNEEQKQGSGILGKIIGGAFK